MPLLAASRYWWQFGANISSLRDKRLPKGPRFASESLDADTASGPVFKLTHYREFSGTQAQASAGRGRRLKIGASLAGKKVNRRGQRCGDDDRDQKIMQRMAEVAQEVSSVMGRD